MNMYKHRALLIVIGWSTSCIFIGGCNLTNRLPMPSMLKGMLRGNSPTAQIRGGAQGTKSREQEKQLAVRKQRELAYLQRCSPDTIPFDFSKNPLADRKYEKSALLHNENGLKVYFVKNLYNRNIELVAVHENIGEYDPILEFENSGFSQKVMDHFHCAISPKVEKLWPNARLIRIAHYVAGIYLPNDPYRSDNSTEQPVLISQYMRRPPFTFDSKWKVDSKWKLERQPNTVAAARKKRVEAIERKRRRSEAYKRERQTGREQAAKREHQKRERALKSGVVYKSGTYWSQFQYGEVLKRVFNGERVPSKTYRTLFTVFVARYSDYCGKYLPADSRTFDIHETTTTTDGYGNVVGKSTKITGTIRVDPRFAPKYQEYHEAADKNQFGDAVGIIGQILQGGVGKFASNYYSNALGPAIDMGRFLKKENCQSATVYQMSENLLRLANGQESLQAAGQSIPGAANESDAITGTYRFTRFEDGCLHHNSHRKSSYKKWCNCLDRAYKGVMTKKELLRYANDHQAWLDEVRNTKPQGRADPAWRLHDPIGQCLE